MRGKGGTVKENGGGGRRRTGEEGVRSLAPPNL